MQNARRKKKKTSYRETPPVYRRLAVWRSTLEAHTDGQEEAKRKIYVSLAGDIYVKPYAYALARSDTAYLQSLGITATGAKSSLSSDYRALRIYREAWSPDVQNFRHWHLPSSVIRGSSCCLTRSAYELLGVRELYEWQAACLLKVLGPQHPMGRTDVMPNHMLFTTDDGSDHLVSPTPERMAGIRSILYAAPTSGGKSLVAELLMLRAALFCGKRSLLILPHVSLCDEKVRCLRAVFGASSVGLRIAAFHSDDGSAAMWHSGIDIAVCTVEKANALVNRLVLEFMHETALRQTHRNVAPRDPALTSIGLIVIDELHLVGDNHRGFLLELLLTKLRRLFTLLAHSANHAFPLKEPIDIRLVGLSATLPNLKEVAQWLNAEVFETSVRPLPLHLYYKIENKLMQVLGDGTVTLARELPAATFTEPGFQNDSQQITYKDHDHLGFLVSECVGKQEQCLVFCATKDWCERACAFLSKILPQYLAQCDAETEKHQVEERQSLLDALTLIARSQTAVCPILLMAIPHGVAYHHAGLTMGERVLIEEAYRKGCLLVLCATSTLAVGVNLPVARVIFRSTQIGREALDGAQFRQMAGRAGRKGFDLRGEAIALCTDASDASRTAQLLSAPVQPVRSALLGMRLARLILELIVLRLAVTVSAVVDTILQESFYSYQMHMLKASDDAAWSQHSFQFKFHLRRAFQYLVANATVSVQQIPAFLIDADKENVSCNNENAPERPPVVQPLDALAILMHFFDTSSTSLQELSKQFAQPFNVLKRLLRQQSTLSGIQHQLPWPLPLALLRSTNVSKCTTVEDSCVFSPECDLDYFFSSESLSSADVPKRDSSIQPTPLGTAIVETALSIPDGVQLFSELYRVRLQGLLLKSELHLLYLVAPSCVSVDLSLGACHFDSLVTRLDRRSDRVAEFYGITVESARQAFRQRFFSSQTLDNARLHELWMTETVTLNSIITLNKMLKHRRFYYALVLFDLFHEAPLSAISTRFKLRLGALQTLKKRAVLQAGQAAAFCDKLQWSDLSAVFRRLGEKLAVTYATPESVELGSINFVQERQAAALWAANLRTVKDVSQASVSQISQALEGLGRTEVPAGEEGREFLQRHARRRAALAARIRESARNIIQHRASHHDICCYAS